MKNITIALADDQLLFKQSLGILISSVPEFKLLFDAENGLLFLEQLRQMKVLPDIALIDIEMPEMDGMELLEVIKKEYPDIKVLILSAHSSERLISRLIQMGACGYLLKNCDKEELITALHSVQKNGFYINQHTLKAIQNAASNKKTTLKSLTLNNGDITQREIEVLQLICQQFNNAEIGEKLFISPRTVEGHRNNLLLKAGVKNTAGLVLFAVKKELFEV